MGAPVTVSAETPVSESLPDGTSVPTEAIQAPASVSSGSTGSVAPGVEGDTSEVVRTASTNAIPSAALAAYQRAETVINSADKACNLSWQLVAAIGRVESDHGRYGGNTLDDEGVARPGILGIALNGKNNTQAIRDTDAGQFDDDGVWDRAVGPMQFIPSTWSVVGVDADGDSQRNPQDIDDAALATAVYLCSGGDDLSTTSGQRSAVYRYNHSNSYVSLVLGIMDAYLEGDFMSIPNGTVAAGVIAPSPAPIGPGPGQGPGDGPRSGPDTVITPEPGPSAAPSPSAAPQPTPDTGGEQGGGDGDDKGDGPKGGLGVPGLPTPSLPPLPSTGIDPVDGILSFAQAVVQCTLDGYIDNILKKDDPFDQCVKEYTTP
ncbi:lytic transglycosylase domain-containing protein [Nocardioides sp. SOB77]|uniref:Lytic transglycosylase domain-containing protein n=1 Tax=Nocardioides oceani TaxID=3058369 RepID=A0ABT8FB09_9ACTN|nr:lytic transglycosylase domain-containing protein [Nocardioides oceani]MDN4171760.1 lytic transglycosylase domain-containing protein [Nocardioides oceani]